MKLIKLDAIDSTNDFLKGLSNNQILENFTVVTAQSQTKGKGQMGAQWLSETGKNLIVSVLIKNTITDISQIFNLNVAIALAILESLNDFEIPNVSIKWPNDIMADEKKIGGILIESSFKSSGEIISIVGFGINVNQIHFFNLPKASSLKNITNKHFDIEILLNKILEQIQITILKLENPEQLWQKYNTNLFKKQIMMPFELKNGKKIMGIIQQVLPNGKLQILLENEVVSEFEIKEIQMLF